MAILLSTIDTSSISIYSLPPQETYTINVKYSEHFLNIVMQQSSHVSEAKTPSASIFMSSTQLRIMTGRI